MNKYVAFIRDRDNQRKYLKWLIKITSKSRKSLLWLAALDTAVAVAAVVVSIVNKSIVDSAQDRVRFNTLVTVMIILQLFSLAGGALESLLESIITEKYACSVRRNLFDQFLRIPWLKRSAYHSEELLSRITSDVEQITSGIGSLVISGGAMLIELILAFILLWNYSPPLAIAIVVIAPVGVIAGKLISKGLNGIQKEYQQTEADYRIFLQERLSKADLIRIFNQEEQSIRKLQEIQASRLQLVRKKNLWKILGYVVIAVTFTGAQIAAFIIGALMVSDGSITFGVMTAFLSLVGHIQGPIYSLANRIPQIVGVLASAGRLMEITEIEKESADTPAFGGEKAPVPGAFGIAAEKVCIGYGSETIVDSVSFNVKPGQMVMLVGESGIGKTTLLRSIMGFLDVSAGELRFYDKNGTYTVCGPNTRKWISYVPQGNTLMFGTIADNLRIGKEDASEDEMRAALRLADALEFVESLPEGLNTVIGEKATGISEGQAQRIAIARALLKKASILILDEATSSLDEKTEAKILEALSHSDHPTCLFVSHRKYLSKYADAVIEL